MGENIWYDFNLFCIIDFDLIDLNHISIIFPVLCYGELEWPTILMVHGNQDSASTFCPLLK